MQAKEYRDFANYLRNGTLPGSFPSTKSNFLKTAKKMKINRKGVLLRDSRIVVKHSERHKIFEEMHQHSGKNFRKSFAFSLRS